MYIDDNGYEVGEIGFLVRKAPEQGADRHSLYERPCHTNQSHEPRLFGWCGTTNNVAHHAEGLAEVTKILKNGRVQVRKIEATPERLEELGYPELAES